MRVLLLADKGAGFAPEPFWGTVVIEPRTRWINGKWKHPGDEGTELFLEVRVVKKVTRPATAKLERGIPTPMDLGALGLRDFAFQVRDNGQKPLDVFSKAPIVISGEVPSPTSIKSHTALPSDPVKALVKSGLHEVPKGKPGKAASHAATPAKTTTRAKPVARSIGARATSRAKPTKPRIPGPKGLRLRR